MAVLNAYIIVSPSNVELGEPLFVDQASDKFLDEWEGIGVLDCIFV